MSIVSKMVSHTRKDGSVLWRRVTLRQSSDDNKYVYRRGDGRSRTRTTNIIIGQADLQES